MLSSLTCPECKGDIWDMPHGHKLAKCWGCGLAFDTMTDDDGEPTDQKGDTMSGFVYLSDEALESLECAGVSPARIAAMRETRDELGPDGLTGLECTLDGVPAKITGRKLPFAIVATWPDGPDQLPDLVADFAWPTVARVMAAGGAFRT